MIETLTEIFTPGSLQLLLRSAGVTVLLSAIGTVCGAAIGVTGSALQTYPNTGARMLRVVLSVYVQVVRRVPLLLLLLIAYVTLVALGYQPSNFIVACVGVTVYAGGHLSENFRSGIDSIPRDQWQAGASLGLTHTQVLWHIVLPQAMRVSLAASGSFVQTLIKDTSMAVVIGLVELTKAGLILRYRFPLEAFWIFLALMILYFLICYPVSKLSEYLERRFN